MLLSWKKILIMEIFLLQAPPEDIDKYKEAAAECIAHPEKIVSLQIRKPDALTGDFYWMGWEFSSFKDKDKQVIGLLCLGHDITTAERSNQIQAKLTDSEEKLKQTEYMLSAIYHSTTEACILMSIDYQIMYFNKAAAEMVKIYRDNLLKLAVLICPMYCSISKKGS